MNTVLSLIILIRQNSLQKDNNYMIADYLLKNINLIEQKSIHEIADECYVSTNTVLRFCHLLGFDTYKKFKSNLISTLKIRKIQLKDKNQNLSPEQILEHIDNISESFQKEIFKKTLDQIVDEMNTYKVIHLYGAIFPLALSQSFIEDMALLGVEVCVHQSGYTDIELSDDGIHMIISYSGRFIEVIRSVYQNIVSMEKPIILISKMKENIGEIDYPLVLPQTVSSHYDDIILLLIYDYLLIRYDCLYNHD